MFRRYAISVRITLSYWHFVLALHGPLSLKQVPLPKREHRARFQAGAAAIDISPTQKSSIIAGGFLEAQSDRINDRLFVRCIVLDDGQTKIAMAVVDTCMMTQELIDQAKIIASHECGIAVDHMMVSATHTHSAPAAMGCLGTRQDKEYAKFLPGKIAQAIVTANSNLQPAQIGWASIDDWEHTHNRRWIRKPENKILDPFGNATGLAHMHPGYLSRDVIGPSGPVDPGLSVISVKTAAGRPLAVLANYSQHYFGAGAVSADYFGRFAKYVADSLGEPGEGNGPFICAMSQGTSGDLMWMDYGAPTEQIAIDRYAETLAQYATKALESITYADTVALGMVEKKLSLAYRVPDPARLAWAKPIAAKIENDLPKNIPEVYAMEALILDKRQQTEIKLQAIRIGDLTIATLPNEVYALTGLKLKAQSPFTTHFNIELANGAEGYIPTPEQHTLGGYTTWPARTAGLEVQAEPKIVESLLTALEQVTARSRRTMDDEHGPFAQAILRAKPIAYWRLNDAHGTTARNAVGSGNPAQLMPGYAWYLPGVGSGTGIGEHEQLTMSAFSGENQINRAVHLAGGHIEAFMAELSQTYSIGLWFWLGERSGASERSGHIVTLPSGQNLTATNAVDHSVRLSLGEIKSDVSLQADEWNFVVINKHANALSVFINGDPNPAVEAIAAGNDKNHTLRFGENLQGKLDEIFVFDRVLSKDEIQSFWQLSGIPSQRAQDVAYRHAQATALAARIQPPVFPLQYSETITSLKPVVYWSLDASPGESHVDGQVTFAAKTFAQIRGGRIAARSTSLKAPYTVSLWFRCETPNNAQPVTAYFFSRGPNGNNLAPGDHLGIGGTFQSAYVGKLLFFNGNESDQVAVGSHVIPTDTWNHVVMIRELDRMRAYLNGATEPEIDVRIAPTAIGSDEFFLAREAITSRLFSATWPNSRSSIVYCPAMKPSLFTRRPISPLERQNLLSAGHQNRPANRFPPRNPLRKSMSPKLSKLNWWRVSLK